jgi:hypothetical protein
MMNRGNMGKEISTAPKSKKVKKMMMGGMADGARRPAVMPPRPGGPGFFGGGAPRPPMGGPGMPPAGMLEALRNRQAMGMKKGGSVKGMAKGGMATRGDGCAMKGKTKGTMR